MCLATPQKITKIKGQWATVLSEGHRHNHRVNLSLVRGIKIGDFVLVHDGLVLNKIPKSEAKKIMGFIKSSSAPNK